MIPELVDMRSRQAALRQRYREDPAAAQTTLHAHGVTAADTTFRIESGRTQAVAGMHPGVGGTGAEACPGDMLLEALAACAGVTLRAVAAALGIELRHAAVRAEGDLDFRGVMGLSSEAPIAFQRLRVAVELDSAAPVEQLTALMRRTEVLCIVSRTLAEPPEFSWTLRGGQAAHGVAASATMP